MTTLFAQPYNRNAAGFSFDSAAEFAQKADALRDIFKNRVEAFEIVFIGGDDLDRALFTALSLHQDDLRHFFKAVKTWNEEEKIRVVVAIECQCIYEDGGSPDDVPVQVYQADSPEELAVQGIKRGDFQDRPEPVTVETVARHIEKEYRKTTVAGRNIFYRFV